MTEASWKFADGDEDVIGSSNNAVRCPKHPFPLDIPPLPSLTKGTPLFFKNHNTYVMFWVGQISRRSCKDTRKKDIFDCKGLTRSS